MAAASLATLASSEAAGHRQRYFYHFIQLYYVIKILNNIDFWHQKPNSSHSAQIKIAAMLSGYIHHLFIAGTYFSFNENGCRQKYILDRKHDLLLRQAVTWNAEKHAMLLAADGGDHLYHGTPDD